MDSPPDPEDLIPILGNLLEATALPRPDLVAVLLPPADVQQGKLELWKVGVGLAANELAAGVSREAQAGATLNALRLARHLFEYLLCARYVLADPVERLDEAYGDEAAERRKIRRLLRTSSPTQPKRSSRSKSKTHCWLRPSNESPQAVAPTCRIVRTWPEPSDSMTSTTTTTVPLVGSLIQASQAPQKATSS